MKSRIRCQGSDTILQESGDILLTLKDGDEIVIGGQRYIANGRTSTEMLGETQIKDYYVVPEREYIRRLEE